jgi:uncharacterized membrane protein YfcA
MQFDAHLIVPFVAAVVAGAVNSAAGGGSFISFPALLLAGFPPIVANATNNTAMWIGSTGSIGGFREDFTLDRATIVPPMVVGIVGSTIGSILLLRTPETTFQHAIPYLLAFATIVFAASPWLRGSAPPTGTRSALATLGPLFCVAVYGGYFGAGIGIMLLALFAATTALSLARVNAQKNLMTFFINGTAVVPFAIAHAIVWPVALLMAVGAVGGAYGGARLIRRLPPFVVRTIVIAIGAGMSIYFFVNSG